MRKIAFKLFGSFITPNSAYGSFISDAAMNIQNDKSLAQNIFPLIDLISPKKLLGSEKIRIGAEGDGGYYVINRDYKDTFLISGGIEYDNSFEYQLAEKGALGIQLDDSVDSAPLSHVNLTFKKSRLGTNLAKNEIDLENLLIYSKNSNRNKIILKLDIEGSEWDLLSEFENLSIFDQIIIELHNLSDLGTEKSRLITQTLDKINKDFFCFSFNANNCCGFSIISGTPIPKTLEVSLANRNSYNFEKIFNEYPNWDPISNYSANSQLSLFGLQFFSTPKI